MVDLWTISGLYIGETGSWCAYVEYCPDVRQPILDLLVIRTGQDHF
jgi:hypothetical protein